MDKSKIEIKRCEWAQSHTLHSVYHDEEWGRPTSSPYRLFEKICLEGFQSGLSWLTILQKRERFRHVFEGFDFEKVAVFNENDVERLLGDAGIVRHRGKIEATINNAQRACEITATEGSFTDWIWSWAVESPYREMKDGQQAIVSQTARSAAFAKELKSKGWRFFGPTTAYAFMQSEGLTNDHEADCFIHQTCEEERLTMLNGRTLRS